MMPPAVWPVSEPLLQLNLLGRLPGGSVGVGTPGDAVEAGRRFRLAGLKVPAVEPARQSTELPDWSFAWLGGVGSEEVGQAS